MPSDSSPQVTPPPAPVAGRAKAPVYKVRPLAPPSTHTVFLLGKRRRAPARGSVGTSFNFHARSGSGSGSSLQDDTHNTAGEYDYDCSSVMSRSTTTSNPQRCESPLLSRRGSWRALTRVVRFEETVQVLGSPATAQGEPDLSVNYVALYGPSMPPAPRSALVAPAQPVQASLDVHPFVGSWLGTGSRTGALLPATAAAANARQSVQPEASVDITTMSGLYSFADMVESGVPIAPHSPNPTRRLVLIPLENRPVKPTVATATAAAATATPQNANEQSMSLRFSQSSDYPLVHHHGSFFRSLSVLHDSGRLSPPAQTTQTDSSASDVVLRHGHPTMNSRRMWAPRPPPATLPVPRTPVFSATQCVVPRPPQDRSSWLMCTVLEAPAPRAAAPKAVNSTAAAAAVGATAAAQGVVVPESAPIGQRPLPPPLPPASPPWRRTARAVFSATEYVEPRPPAEYVYAATPRR